MQQGANPQMQMQMMQQQMMMMQQQMAMQQQPQRPAPVMTMTPQAPVLPGSMAATMQGTRQGQMEAKLPSSSPRSPINRTGSSEALGALGAPTSQGASGGGLGGLVSDLKGKIGKPLQPTPTVQVAAPVQAAPATTSMVGMAKKDPRVLAKEINRVKQEKKVASDAEDYQDL